METRCLFVMEKSFERGDTMSKEKADYRLTEKQKRFVDEYVIDLNGTRAYKAAYPNVKKDESARVCASQLLTNPNVRAYLDERLEAIHSAKTADAREVMEYLTAVMRGEYEDETLRFTGDGYQDVVNLRTPTKDRLKAAEMLGRHFSMFTDKVQLDVGPVQIMDNIPGGDQDG